MGLWDRLDPPNKLPDEVRRAHSGADRFELLSLEPVEDDPGAPGTFRGWRVLGTAVVGDADTRRELIAALERGVAASPGIPADCFWPRHGVRAGGGPGTAELVICFECGPVDIWLDGHPAGRVVVSCGPQPTFDSILTAAGVPLAEG